MLKLRSSDGRGNTFLKYHTTGKVSVALDALVNDYLYFDYEVSPLSEVSIFSTGSFNERHDF